MKESLVSVIIPTYKTNRSLKRAIESTLNQSYSNIEVIVVDDNDPNSEYRKVSRDIVSNYKKIRYIQHENNYNGAKARNTGFKYSKGDLICFLDDDDLFIETKIEDQVAFLQTNKEYEGVYSWRYAKHSNKIVKYSKTGDLTHDILKLKSRARTSTLMITRFAFEEIDGFDESFQRHQDLEFMIRFCQHHKLGVVEKPLVKVFNNDVVNTLSGKKLEALKVQFLSKFDSIINEISKENESFKKEVYAVHFSSVFLSYLKNNEFRNALRILVSNLRVSGFFFIRELFRLMIRFIVVRVMILLNKKDGYDNERV